ncbi:MAG: NAD-dependent epimerase/dehydratase family protein [Acidimicrobiales bacterium]
MNTDRISRHHVVAGAGGIGSAIALHLARDGHTVTLVSRSGSGPEHPAVARVGLDLTDGHRLADLAQGARSIVNAVNPKYTRWLTDWPPLAAAFLTAAERSGAGLVTVGNLYAYGPVEGPMTEDLPLRPTSAKAEVRATMWREALAAHEAGRIRATELRASDYFGPGARPGVALLNDYVIRPAARRRTAWVPIGDLDAPHSWTYLPDIAALAAALATTDDGWGRPWHVPTAAPRSMRQVVQDVAALGDGRGRGNGKVAMMPGRTLVRALIPTARELKHTEYQFVAPFVLDSSRTQEAFGLAPTPWTDALAATGAHYQR